MPLVGEVQLHAAYSGGDIYMLFIYAHLFLHSTHILVYKMAHKHAITKPLGTIWCLYGHRAIGQEEFQPAAGTQMHRFKL